MCQKQVRTKTKTKALSSVCNASGLAGCHLKMDAQSDGNRVSKSMMLTLQIIAYVSMDEQPIVGRCKGVLHRNTLDVVIYCTPRQGAYATKLHVF